MSILDVIFLLCLLCVVTGYAAADTRISVPNELDFAEGNTGTIIPFSAAPSGHTNPAPLYPSMRYQQVYDASQFRSLDTNGEFITYIAFRTDTDTGYGFTGVLRDVQMNFSTTSQPPDGLSTNFEQNVGIDDTVIFKRGEFQFGAGYGPFDRPQGFFIQIKLAPPFFFRPQNGNLLYDVRIYTYSNSLLAAPFDAVNTVGDSVSRLIATNVSSQVGATDTTGLVTLFYTTSIPQLEVLRTNQDLFFRWWDQPKGFVLEGRTNLTNANWQLVSTPSVYNDGYREVTLPLDTSTLGGFFRLAWNPPPGSSASGSSGVRTRHQTAKAEEP